MVYRQRWGNKYGAKRTTYNGRKYDSKFEACVARDLDLAKQAGEIEDWEPQYKLEMWAHDSEGNRKIKMTHKVDFRIHEKDGTYTLLEAKGVETADYRIRRRWLENLWLPDHPDHTYEVVKQSRW